MKKHQQIVLSKLILGTCPEGVRLNLSRRYAVERTAFMSAAQWTTLGRNHWGITILGLGDIIHLHRRMSDVLTFAEYELK